MSDNVALSIRQFAEAWRIMCRAMPNHAMASTGGVEYVFSGLPIPFFNVAISSQRDLSADALQSQGRDACGWASQSGVPWLMVVTHEALADGLDAAAALEGCGLAPLMPLTGMLASRVAPASRIPDGLEVGVPDDDSGCTAILDVNSAAYGMPLDAARQSLGRASFWRDHFPVLGRVGGEPVSSTAVLMADGYRYVALVATAPDQQRRGYADAAMRHALRLAAEAHGERPSVLHATAAGKPVYERMGYETISTHTLFIERKFLGEH
jgi:GNAT superfamily N-acetyltransferase